MGSDLQCSWIAFLAVVNVFEVLIFSGALFHTLAASQIKLFFALVDLPTSVRPPRVTPLVSIAFSIFLNREELKHDKHNKEAIEL
jgi:hypothetical protein